MLEPIILSDKEDHIPPSTSFRSVKRRRTGPGPNPNPNPTVLILDDDDLAPHQSTASTPFFDSPSSSSDIEVVKCTKAPSGDLARPHDSDHKLSGIDGLICLESDDDSESGCGVDKEKENESVSSGFGMVEDLDLSYRSVSSPCSLGHDLAHTVEEETKEAERRKKMTNDERAQLMEEKKLKKLQEKMQREALKAKAADMKKIEKEMQRWEKGKSALKSIVADIDCKVVELGSVGDARFAERGITYRIKSNPIERSIIWTMTVPEQFSKLHPQGKEIQYILLVYEAEEFCKLVIKDSLLEHISRVQSIYPSYTVCYLTNRCMAMYINNREQEAYKNQMNTGRTYPTAKEVELVLAKFTTIFFKLHSPQCRDEVELAEHVVGLTCSLSTCIFRKQLTRLDVNAIGASTRKDRVDRDLLTNNIWLRTLVAIPKVQPRCATAICKKYPTMK